MLVTPDGWRVQGYTQIDPVDRQHRHHRRSRPTSSFRPACCARRRRRPTSAPRSTSTPNVAIDPANPEFTTSIQIYDALGSPHVLTVDFNRTGAGAWTYTVTVPQVDVTRRRRRARSR